MRPTSVAILGLGALGVLGGFVARGLRPTWGSYTDAAMAAGGLLLVAFLVVERSQIMALTSGRRLRYGANAVIYTAIVTAIVGVLNFIGQQHPKRVDLTEGKLHTLSEQTVKVCQGLTRDVQITSFYRGLHPQQPQAKELLRLYENVTPRVKVAFVDPDKDPALVEKMDVRADGTTVLESGAQKTFVTGATEDLLTNAILKVSRDTQPRIYVLEGSGEMSTSAQDGAPERGLVQAKDQLLKKGFDVVALGGATAAEIPRDAALVVVADPLRALPERAVAMLGRFLDEGGRALVLADARHDAGLGEMLGRYGITLGNDLVLDPTLRMVGGPAEAILVGGRMFRFHPITDRFAFTVYLSLARSVTPREDPAPDVTVVPLFHCSAGGWAETSLDAEVVRYDEGVDRAGPVSLAAAATWKARITEPPVPAPAAGDGVETPGATPSVAPPELPATPAATPPAPTPAVPAEPIKLGGTPGADWAKAAAPATSGKRFDEGRLVVVGDADWAGDTILPDASLGNGALFLNMVSWLAEAEELIAVPPKKPGSYQVRVGVAETYTLGLLTLVVLPGGILAFGISNWWRRRRL